MARAQRALRPRALHALLLPVVLFPASAAFEPTAPVERDFNELVHLHKDNFDEVVKKYDEVLVHFHAPWSKRCDVLRPHLRTIQQSSEWGKRFVFAESDISDSRGYTTYLEHYGVTRLPAIVLFRNGHPDLYPSQEPLAQAEVEAWLFRATQDEATPRHASDQAVNVKMLEAKANAEERIKKIQQEAAQQEEARRKDEQQQPTSTTASPSETAETESASQTPPAAEGGDTSSGRSLEEAASSDEGSECAALGAGLSDGTFEKVVMDKSRDVFVLFYHSSAAFCGGNGTAYGAFAQQLRDEAPSVTAEHMDVRVHKSPFVFEESELPVAMLFPADDKRPLEFDQAFTMEFLMTFVTEHGTTLKSKAAKGEL